MARSNLTSLLPAVAGFVTLSAVAGILVAIGAAPVVTTVGLGSRAAVEVFDELPEFIEVGKLQQRNVLYAMRGGQQVPFATLYDQNRVSLASEKIAPTLKGAVVAGEDRRFRNWRIGGYHVKTTLDLDLTAVAKDQVTRYAPNSETRYDLGGVVVSVEAESGRVVVLTHNKDFDDTQTGGGSTTSAVNYAVDKNLGESGGFQPGSTYKPFTLIDWLAKGHRLTEWVNAKPRTFSPMTVCGSPESNNFRPKNDNGGDPGWVTTRQATASSINTAYAAMAQKLDLCDIRNVAKSLGVHPADGGELSAFPSSVIGSGNTVAPLTMASAFAAIANGGVYCKPVFIDAVVDPGGKELPGDQADCTQAIDPGVAALTASAMQGVFSGGTASSAKPFDGVPILGKTGTTDHAEQTWLVGGSTKVVTAAWVGNITGHQNQYRIYGAHGAMNVQRLTIWKNVQAAINGAYGGVAFARPAYSPPEANPSIPKPETSDEPRGDGGGGDGAGSGRPTSDPAPPSNPGPATQGSNEDD